MRYFLGLALSICLCFPVPLPSFADDNPAAQFQQDFLAGKLKWQDILDQAAREGQVSFLYWGGNDVLNVWVDSVAGPAMEALGITLLPNRLTSTGDAVDLVLSETSTGKHIGQGSADVMWLNGENFYTLVQQQRLFGSFARNLPNSKNFDWNGNDRRSHANLWDFGIEIKAREIAWSSEQYVCAVNRQYVSVEDTPRSFDDLQSYLKRNAGKFTYVKPPSDIGSTFVQAALYAFNPDANGATPFQQSAHSMTPTEFARLIEPGMTYLKSLGPLLFKNSNGKPHYAVDAKAADTLFREGKTHFTCEFGTYAAATKIATGHYPATAEAMVFPKGLMIKNKNFLAIPSNTAHPAAAIVLANYMSSVEAQASKLGFVGYPTGIDHWMLKKEDISAIEKVAPPHIGVTQSELDANAVPDTNATLVEIINEVWRAHIEGASDKSIEELVTDAYPKSDD